jgi:putative restriction endonuclease
LDADGEFDPDNVADTREKIMRSIRERRGQKAFRDKLLKVYGGRCAISGCDIVDLLEAAHITPHLGRQTNLVTNGLLLRSDLHTLLDCGLLAIDPRTRNVFLARVARESADYKYLLDRRVRDPVSNSDAPSLKVLQAAWRKRVGT